MNKIKFYGLNNFRSIPMLNDKLSEADKFAIEIVGKILPFRTNDFVVNELIDWNDPFNDPMYKLTFPQKEMLTTQDFNLVAGAVKKGASKTALDEIVAGIRQKLNPNPAGQMDLNVPSIEGERITGIQHKYQESVLFFPGHGQTCHAYCTYCFRWPQFIGVDELRFSLRNVEVLVNYLKTHKQVTDVIITGGDPLIMSTERLRSYIQPLLYDAELSHIRSIRLGTKSLSYWPGRFLTDADADDLLMLFEEIVKSGKGLSIMAHFSHIREMMPPVVAKAIQRVIGTGAQIRTQAPIMAGINDNADVWRQMWVQQVKQGCIPYYMFIARDTGAQHYFAVPIVKALNIFQQAYRKVSGLAKTVRGPVMSAEAGKIHVLGTKELHGEKLLLLQFLQARNPQATSSIFFAHYNEDAIWISDLDLFPDEPVHGSYLNLNQPYNV